MDGPARDALVRMYEDARSYHRTSIEAMASLDDKSSRVLRVNVLLMGLFASLATVLLRTSTPDPMAFPAATALFFAGTGGLGVSTFFAIVSYLRKDVSTGVTHLGDHLDKTFAEADYLARSIEAHERAADRNLELVDGAGYWFQNALGTLTASLGTLLSASVVATFGPEVGLPVAGLAVGAGAFVTLKEWEG